MSAVLFLGMLASTQGISCFLLVGERVKKNPGTRCDAGHVPLPLIRFKHMP